MSNELANLLAALAAYFQHQRGMLNDMLSGDRIGQDEEDLAWQRNEVTAVIDAIAAMQKRGQES